MIKRLPFPVILFFILLINVSLNAQDDRTVYQYSVISALLEGDFEGELTISELKKHGTFGLGTFNNLDGELVLLDSVCYQINSEGKVNIVPGDRLSPFAIVTNFNAALLNSVRDNTYTATLVSGEYSLQNLFSEIDKAAVGTNYIYAIRVEGEFSYMKTRSVPPQQKPFKKLVEVTKTQPIFEFENVKGTLVGFRFPSYTEGVNLPGYHFHFISDDKTKGGHVLDLKSTQANFTAIKQTALDICFPQTEGFNKIDLSKKKSEDLKQAEQNPK